MHLLGRLLASVTRGVAPATVCVQLGLGLPQPGELNQTATGDRGLVGHCVPSEGSAW